MKIASLIPDIRTILRDKDARVYDDAVVLGGIKDAVRHLNSVRPESRYDDEGLLNDIEFPETDDEVKAFSLPLAFARWRLGLIYFAVARCYETGVVDSVNAQLAANFKQQANQEFAL